MTNLLPSGAPHGSPSTGQTLPLTLLRQALAGASGGMLVFVLLEPNQRAAEMAGNRGAGDAGFWLGLLFGGIVSGLLMTADDLSSGRPLRILLRGAGAALAGAGAGVVFAFMATVLFNVLLLVLGESPFSLFFARTLGWALFGLGAGLSAALLYRSGRRIAQGCLGGVIGGALGGILFDVLGEITRAGTLSRLVGFVAVGACVGFATALVEQLAKVAWVSFLSGAREGRQVVLHRDVAVLGRDELADIPLFGDMAVEKYHAELYLKPGPMIREVAGSPILRVDRQKVREAALYDGVLVEVGSHRFRFHQRAMAGLPAASPVLPVAPVPDYPPATTATSPYPPQPPGWTAHTAPPAVVASPGAPLQLRLVAGAYEGTVLPLSGGGITLGREVGNTLPIPDRKISRFHLRVEQFDGSWVMTDLGSTNGTRLNGLQVTRAGLAPGDFIYLGDTVIAVEAVSG
jgi:hypothetical protein